MDGQLHAAHGCRDFQESLRLGRRDFLRAGSLTALGLTLPDLFRAIARAASPPTGGPPVLRPRARSCILIYLFGGPSQLDMWDMKPDAPAEIRGEFRPTPTKVPGTRFCEHLPRLAEVADTFALVRTVTHERSVHGSAVGFVLTGTRTNDPGIPGIRGPDATVADHPTMAAVTAALRPVDLPVPAAVTLPWTMTDGQGRFVPGQTAGLLSAQHDPWFVTGDPSQPGFRLEGLTLPADATHERVASRRRLLDVIDRQRQHLDAAADVGRMDAYYQKAFSLLTAPRIQEAFRIENEDAKLRDQYGRNRFGQSCLVARRLVEAGVRFVQVNMGNELNGDFGWDTHRDNFDRLRNKLLPKFDPAFSTLLFDLRQRGLLDEALVVAMGEFGRTAKISKIAGREHWPQCYTVALAGAGIRGGLLYGRSDSAAQYPLADPVAPEDLIATVYQTLGIDPHQDIRDSLGRALRLVNGDPIAGLFA